MVLPTPKEPSGYVQRIAGDGSGLEVSPYRLLEDQFVQGEIRHRPSQPGILLFQGLEPLGLLYF
jgi:hypothetical protein